jgi:arylsulfatase A-like enzyme
MHALRSIRLLVALGLLAAAAAAGAAAPPNLLFILADDLGYGDLRSFNPGSRIPTPNLDRLAGGGMVFADAHAASAVCTPSRYGLLTGRYPWRSRLKEGVQGGMSPPLIEEGRVTVASFLQRQGYRTACIGKWHLGMEWARQEGTPAFGDSIERGAEAWRVDFSRPIRRGPLHFGFDHFFGIAASLDMVPYTFIEDDHVVEVPSVDRDFPMMVGRTNRFTRRGPGVPGFEATAVLPTLTDQAIAYLRRQAGPGSSGTPFFLYLALNAPHTPIAPGPDWVGRSGINPYADFVMQMDSEVGRLLDALEREGLSRNTAVFFASDNGCSPEAQFRELRSAGHDPSGGLRGAKADIFDGGHRVPLIVRWPGHTRPGSRSDELVCLNDFFATCADMLGRRPPGDAAEDSVSLLPLLEGRARGAVREAVVHESINGSLALRQGRWKLEFCPDSGGWSEPVPGGRAAAGLPPVQLYDMVSDPAETRNEVARHPDRVARMRSRLEQCITRGRSTPGPRRSNTTPVRVPAVGPRAGRVAMPPPNILLVIADQWRAQAFGYAGDPNVRTPNLDRFERASVNFCQAVAGMPVCSPTRASLLTGQRPHTHGVFLNDVPLSPDAWTLPKSLKASGYDTGCIGKWHVDGHGERSGFIPRERRHGFDYWKVMECTHSYNESYYYGDAPRKLKWEGYDAISQTRDARQYLRDHASTGRPFLLWLAWGPPHNPYETAPERYRAMYPPDSIRLRPNIPVSAQPTARRELAGYYAHCSALDDCFGDLMRTLEETGLATNTIVIFTSDHGDMLWSQNQQRKQRPWEESARVPMLWRLPQSLGIRPGRIQATLSTEDVVPTLLELCSLPIPASVEGLDFTPAMRRERDPSGGEVVLRCLSPFGEFVRDRGGREYRALRTSHHTYVRDLFGPWLLYDNLTDPYQQNNLAGTPGAARLQRRLEDRLALKLREQGDDFVPGPVWIARRGYRVDATGTAPYNP